jgi:hypothetical protein
MAIDHNSMEYQDLRSKLNEVVSTDRISSLEIISGYVGLDQNTTRELLRELVEEGRIEGNLSEDGARFFLSSIRLSEAPVIPHNDIVRSNEVNTKPAKIIALIGIAMIVTGSVMRSLAGLYQNLENAGVAIFMIGLIIVTIGWIQISRNNPPEELR